MNGPIVLNIALCLYGNAFQQNEIIPNFFNNSTAQFCKKIEFSLIRKSLLGKTEKKIIYENPNNFFDKLGALYTQFNLYYESINKNDGLEERMSAGFIGGGGKWNLVSTNEKDTSVWTAFWDVIDQNNPNKKIWGVNYIKTGNQYLCNEDDDNYINNLNSPAIDLMRGLYFNIKAEKAISNYTIEQLQDDEYCYSTSHSNERNLQESSDSSDGIIFLLNFTKVNKELREMINEINNTLNGNQQLRNLQRQLESNFITAINNLNETIEHFNCSYLKKEIEILYDSLYELSIESRISCALCSCIAFFAEFSVIFYLLVLYHYNNNLFKDENETQNSFHKTKNRKFDLESQNEFMDKRPPANMKQNNKKLDIEFNFN